MARAQAPLRWLFFGRWRNTRSCRTRAPCRAGCDRPTRYGRVLRRQKAPSLLGQDRGATCELWSPSRSRYSCGTHARATALAVSRDVAKHAILPHARRAALVVIGLRTTGGHITSGGHLSFGARPWCDVRAVTSNVQPAFAWHARKRRCAGCFSGGGETRKLAACVPCRAGRDLAAHYGVARHRRGASLLRCKIVVRRACCDLQVQPALAWNARKRHCGGCLSGGGEIRKLAARTPCRAGCDRSTCYGTVLHRREAPLFRLNIMVRRASCDLQRVAGIGVAHTHAPLRWLSLGRWRNTRPYHKRAVPRWL